jgi:hypothetical protein
MNTSLSEAELHEELQRFSTQFADRITQATEVLEEQSTRQDVRDAALRMNLRYVSSALEIATGQFAEVNLLDMIVLIRLSRAALEKHWIPQLYGEAGHDLAEVFARSEGELASVAERTLSVDQRRQLDELVAAWLAENPDQMRVEGIRLADFSSAAGTAAERVQQAKGLLAGVKNAARTANQALLLSERGLFLLQRLPFMWRLQARLAAREMLGDTLVQLSEGPEAPIARVTRQARHLARRSALYVGLLGGGGVFLWWLGSLVVNR